MLMDAINGNIGFTEFIVYAVSSLVVIFLTLPIHEYAHAFAAYKLGDNTARYMGRLTLNPLAHIDWIGAACILFFGFGWAKPVPINSRYFKRGKTDVAITAFAGPLSNLIVAFLSVFLMFLTVALLSWFNYIGYITAFFYYVAIINIHLAVFNLIPIPPLDGSKILAAVLPNNIYYKIMQYERYVYIVLIVLLYTGILSGPLSNVSNAIYSAFCRLFSMIFSLFI